MINRINLLINKKGLTLIELIMAMLVMTIIMIAVTSAFLPTLKAYEKANDLAEVNTLLDNISTLILNDVNRAVEIPDPNPDPNIAPGINVDFSLKTSVSIIYYRDEGVVRRRVQGFGDEALLPNQYYKFRRGENVFSVTKMELEENAGVATLTLAITSVDGWSRERTYTARPIGLALTPTPTPTPP